MKLTKAKAHGVAAQLSDTARKIVLAMFVEKKGFTLSPRNVGTYHNAIIELIARGVLRADFNLFTSEPITVLEPGGRFVVEILKSEHIPVARMMANPKRSGTPHAYLHDWSIACHAPPRCKRVKS